MTALCENSKIKYTYGYGLDLSIISIIHIGLKKDVDLQGFLKRKESKNVSTTSTPSFYGIFFTTDSADNDRQMAARDPGKYENAALGVMINYINMTHKEFFGDFK